MSSTPQDSAQEIGVGAASVPGQAVMRAEPTALACRAAWARLLITAIGGLVLDLWSKYWAFHSLRQGTTVVIVPNVFEFQTMLNPGALFGIGRYQTPLFLVASGIALVLVAWMFLQSPRRQWFLHVALGAIIAGALGNMYDRVTVRLQREPLTTPHGAIYMEVAAADERGYMLREYPAEVQPPADARPAYERRVRSVGPEAGFVRDFLKISKRWMGGREVWPWVFNVADMLLVGGVAVLTLHLLLARPPKSELPPAAAPELSRVE